MSSSTLETVTPLAAKVQVGDDAVTFELTDGRVVSAPLAWYPRLSHGTPQERQNWRLVAGGRGVNWPDLDEDVSVENLLAGKASGESQASLKTWLEKRNGA